jgi:hypothetical protein
MKQQPVGRHVAPFGRIIPIPSQQAIALSPWCMPSRETTHTNFTVFGLTPSRLEPTFYCTRDEHANHYTTAAVIDEVKA